MLHELALQLKSVWADAAKESIALNFFALRATNDRARSIDVCGNFTTSFARAIRYDGGTTKRS